ncbi:hypothetical protein F5984_05015 [Rudanella paleaurantiibacter]|uniref:Uncharacterized protein n=1 Tax=Rudanella paleaurantiibacter TaxID=2614655 RepID=A0A7J5U1E0_9BACT|nr:hypothetical protein [Rudanella paleaurantiibacter]KAB7731597.1 hypothetical protein F5984_05015 [Rudanella paleaurantiibacter]
MLQTLSAFLYRTASRKTLWLATLLYLPFPTLFFRNLEEKMNKLAGQPIGPIDLLFGYNPDRIMQMVAAYGPEGRAIYAQGELTIDLIYPIVYTFLLATVLSLLFRKRPYAPFAQVNLLPLSVLFFDFCENACIVYLLKSYPATSPTVAALCSVLTTLKWLAAAAVLGLIVYGVIRRATGRGR